MQNNEQFHILQFFHQLASLWVCVCVCVCVVILDIRLLNESSLIQFWTKYKILTAIMLKWEIILPNWSPYGMRLCVWSCTWKYIKWAKYNLHAYKNTLKATGSFSDYNNVDSDIINYYCWFVSASVLLLYRMLLVQRP